MAYHPSRRDVLKATAAAAVGGSLAPSAFASGFPKGEGGPAVIKGGDSALVRTMHIGVDGRAGAHVNAASKLGVIVAMSDVDAEKRAKASVAHPSAATFSDYRQMIDAMHKHVDAVFIGIPDHSHAAAAAYAMKAGLAVYCEKPLTRTVWEARQLRDMARKAKVVTQMGNQGTASSNLRRMAKHLQMGTFGKVKEVHCWTNRAGGWWPQGTPRPESKPLPASLNWDVWLGPAPERPYADGYHPFAWRGYWDFGCGALGDIGCHCMNLPFMGLDLRDPTSIQAQTSGNNKETFPEWSIVTYEFPKRGNRDALNLYWYDGGKLPNADLAPGVKLDVNGSLIVCEKATLYSPHEYGMETQLIGGMSMEELPAVEIVESPGHIEEFMIGVATGKKPMSNFDYSGPLTETVVLGNLAVWADGPKLEWDAKSMKVKGSDEYDMLLHPHYREPWTL